MGDLLYFTAREARQRTAPAEGTAEILIFTGVRIERHGLLADGVGEERGAVNSE